MTLSVVDERGGAKSHVKSTKFRKLLHQSFGLLGQADYRGAAKLLTKAVKTDPRDSEALHLLGLAQHGLGQFDKAAHQVRRAITHRGDVALYHRNLSAILLDLGDAAGAFDAVCQAIALSPNDAHAFNNKGNALTRLKRYDDAIAAFDRALELDSNLAQAHFNKANALVESEAFDKAIASFEAAVKTNPAHWQSHENLGHTLAKLGRFSEALEAFEAAQHLAPHQSKVYLARAEVLQELSRHQDALVETDRALAVDASNADAWIKRARSQLKTNDPAGSFTSAETASQLRPDTAEAHLLMGLAQKQLGHFEEALWHVDRALNIEPGNPAALISKAAILRETGNSQAALAPIEQAVMGGTRSKELFVTWGNVLSDLHQIENAKAKYATAVHIDPDYHAAHTNLGNMYKAQANYEKAQWHYGRALDLCPNDLEFAANFLFSQVYDPAQSDKDLSEAHRRIGQRLSAIDHPYRDYPQSADPQRSLRIGLVSADFGLHPTGYFLAGLMAHADAKSVEYYCYSARKRPDLLTQHLHHHAAAWRSILGLTDEALCEQIRADQIDILIDLSGYTAGSRLSAFARKPAPVQATWLGSCHTTGLPAIDYIIMDPHYIAPNQDHLFTEKVVRLPDIRWCYTAPEYIPPVAPPPSQQIGTITFGSFNNLCKLNGDVIAVWSRILEKTPKSKLMLSWPTLADPAERERLTDSFTQRGVSPSRLTFISETGRHQDTLADYHKVDIALDPFPFSGCISTCEALTMGVPVVTLPQSRPCSRQTWGFLNAIGRTEWAAKDEADYVDIATRLASSPDRLARWRRTQRQRVLESPMSDAALFASNIERLFRTLWKLWCDSNTAG